MAPGEALAALLGRRRPPPPNDPSSPGSEASPRYRAVQGVYDQLSTYFVQSGPRLFYSGGGCDEHCDRQCPPHAHAPRTWLVVVTFRRALAHPPNPLLLCWRLRPHRRRAAFYQCANECSSYSFPFSSSRRQSAGYKPCFIEKLRARRIMTRYNDPNDTPIYYKR